MKTFQKLLRAVVAAQNAYTRHVETANQNITDSYRALDGLWGEDYYSACLKREAERDFLWDEGDRLNRTYMEARNAFVEALDAAPRGAYGSAFVQEHRLYVCGPVRKVLSFNREPVATLSADLDLALRGDYGWAVPTKAETCAANRAAAKAYAASMADAAAMTIAGVRLPYRYGKHGGYFVLPDGACVSAPGLVRRLGLPEAAWYDGPWAEAVHQYALACAAVAPEQVTAPTTRERAAARWARNCPRSAPRPCGKGKPWTRETPLREALAYA